MSDEQDKANQRAFVAALYPGKSWKRRVKNMPDGQIFAIYKRESNKPKKPRQESDDADTPF